jgi:hypothetical protein
MADFKCCMRCGDVLTAPPVLIEITFYGPRRDREARSVCRECADAIMCFLQARRELAPLEPIGEIQYGHGHSRQR